MFLNLSLPFPLIKGILAILGRHGGRPLPCFHRSQRRLPAPRSLQGEERPRRLDLRRLHRHHDQGLRIHGGARYYRTGNRNPPSKLQLQSVQIFKTYSMFLKKYCPPLPSNNVHPRASASVELPATLLSAPTLLLALLHQPCRFASQMHKSTQMHKNTNSSHFFVKVLSAVLMELTPELCQDILGVC